MRTIIKNSPIKSSPDDILPGKIIKENLELLLPVISNLVNLSLAQGSIDGLKLADIIPYLKGEGLDHNMLKNFRPVSNLQFVGKIIEKIVLSRLNDHLKNNDLNIPEQSAYIKNSSTETLLLRLTNDLLIAADAKSATVVMLLDLSAAFDTVEHKLLLNILKHEIGIRGTALKWFHSFLTSRCQRTRINGFTSEDVVIMFGVPQGSVLGPVLFNIYIRSLYSHIKQTGFDVFGYADDHQILKQFNQSDQHLVLLEDICCCFRAVQRWMTKYFLQLNATKTQIIVFGPPNVLNHIKMEFVALVPGVLLHLSSTVKNLGVRMDSSLTMRKQVCELKKKSFRTIRNICKIRFLLSQDQMKTVVNSLVVCCLDYCNALFYGINEKLMQQLQLLQKAASIYWLWVSTNMITWKQIWTTCTGMASNKE